MAKGRLVRLLILLWLGWYLSGPICEVVDFWDTPTEEMQDVAFHGGGAVSLAAVAFCVGITLASKARTLGRVSARAARMSQVILTRSTLLTSAMATTIPQGVSPPLPLRI